jgi:hypothetical protein
MKALRSLLFTVAVLVGFTAARATTVIPPNFDQLVGEAELIFQGTCTDVKSQWIGEGAEHRIVTYVTFKVEDTLKGTPGDTYTIRMLGGTVDGTTMEVSDAPKFKTGDRDILFVEHNGQQFIPLVGIMHGRYRVQQDRTTGREVLLTNHGEAVTDVKQLGKDEHAATTSSATANALTPADFKAAIKAKLAGDAQS